MQLTWKFSVPLIAPLAGAVVLLGGCAASQPGRQTGAPPQVAEDAQPVQDLRPVAAYIDRLGHFGVSGAFLVSRNGEVVLERAVGLADRERGIPVSTTTVFDIGSITKQFTAAAILRLEEQGKLRVTDSIARFFPEVPEDKRGMTLHHLLTHSSGLIGDFGGDYEAVSRDSIVRLALGSELQWAPGTRFDYSNAGYSLLGVVIELLTGSAYEEYLREQFFRPLGMTRTGYVLPRWGQDDLAVGYRGTQRWGTPIDHAWAPDGPWWNLRANGGILSTVGDLHRWHVALEGNGVLSDASKQKLFSPHVAERPGGDTHYAYGWGVFTTPRGTRLIGHNGGNGYFFADFLRFVDEGTAVILMTNASDQDIQPARARLLAAVTEGRMPKLPPVPAHPSGGTAPDVSRVDPSSYAGSYQLPGGGLVVITGQSGRLLADPVGQDAANLMYGDGASGDWARFTTRSRAIADAIDAGDWEPLRAASSDRLVATIQRIRRTAEETMGSYRSTDVMGTVTDWWDGGSETVTLLRFNYERGSRVFRFHWDGERIAGIGGMAIPSPARLTLIPSTAHSFTGYNIMLEKEIPVEFDVDTAGRAVRLRIGDEVAQRVD